MSKVTPLGSGDAELQPSNSRLACPPCLMYPVGASLPGRSRPNARREGSQVVLAQKRPECVCGHARGPHKPGGGGTSFSVCPRRCGGKVSDRSAREGIPSSSWQAHGRKDKGAAICQGTEASGWPRGVSRGQQESRKLEQGLGKALLCAQACFSNTRSPETKGPFSLGCDAAISGWQCQVVGASGGVNLLSPPNS